MCATLSSEQCLGLVEFTSSELVEKPVESAVASAVEHIREAFGVSCVRIREIIPRPFSLRYTYESLDDRSKARRVNQTVTFDEAEWEEAMSVFSNGIYRYDRSQGEAKFIGRVSHKPLYVIEVPMFCGKHFLGTFDIVEFNSEREWTHIELSAVTICANMICQYISRTNKCFVTRYDSTDIDPLTGLMSFTAFSENLDERFTDMIGDTCIAVVYSDIHHFKYINENYGYKKGDELLKLTAGAMSGSSEEYTGTTLSRVHSDNFVSASALPKEFVPYFEDFIKEQNDMLCSLLEDNCPGVKIRMNTGICYVEDASITAATAIANANLARKKAKSESLRRPLVFADSMMDDINYQEYLNNELPKAIANRELKVYYQPKINCSDDSLYGAEALVRWQKPDGSFIYPDQFIPFFEKNGNIVDVDFYVYREVFRYLRKRLDASLPVFPISMNVSRVHLKSDRIIPYIKELIAKYDVPPSLVEFELTENIYMNNLLKADEFISSCRALGAQVSMDDFGSGYSSLNVMSSLSIDTLKIDRIFLKNEDLNDSDKTIIESMITMAKRLGMNVICEGVETQAQSDFLKKAHCDQIQGYYYGRPMDEESFDKFAMEKLGCSVAKNQ